LEERAEGKERGMVPQNVGIKTIVPLCVPWHFCVYADETWAFVKISNMTACLECSPYVKSTVK
jgi:hypothetical protein